LSSAGIIGQIIRFGIVGLVMATKVDELFDLLGISFKLYFLFLERLVWRRIRSSFVVLINALQVG
jgi:hypothetical protein